MGLSDSKLVERCLGGDDSAFDELVSRYRTRAYRLALSRVRSRDTALDIAQDAFVRAYSSLSSLREPDRFAAWLGGIVSNLCKMQARDTKEMPATCDAIEAGFCHANQTGDNALDTILARQIIDALPDGTRSAALLFFIEEMKQSDIAEFLGIALSAVKSRIRDARRRLQKEMIDMAKQDEPGDEFNEGIRHKLEMARWYREFSELIDSSVPIVPALFRMQQGAFSEPVRKATGRMMEAIQSGSTVHEALQACPELSAPDAVSLVYVGETYGELQAKLRSCAECMEAQAVVRDVELSYWCRTLGTLLVSGVGILSALDATAKVAQREELKQATQDMKQAISIPEGATLRRAIEGHDDTIPAFVQAAILAGEQTGTLDQALLWAGNELAADVCRRLSAHEFHVPWRSEDELRGAMAQGLSSLLDDRSASVRAGAASALGMLKADVEGESIALMLRDGDTRVRVAAIQALVGLQMRGQSQAIAQLLGDSEASVRRAAVQAVGELGIGQAGESVAALLADPDERVSHAASAAIESLNQIDLMAQRAAEMLGDEDWHKRMRGAMFLWEHPVPLAADALIRALDDELDDISFHAAIALARMRRQDAVPKLIYFLDSRHSHYVNESAKALVELGNPSAASHIRRAIEHGKLASDCTWMAEKLEFSG